MTVYVSGYARSPKMNFFGKCFIRKSDQILLKAKQCITDKIYLTFEKQHII